MKAFFLAIALLNAAPKEQDGLILDLYDMDPRLVADVLDVVDELGGYTDDLAIVIAIIADSPGKTAPKKDEYIPGDMWVDGVSEDDGTKAPIIGLMYDPVDDGTKNPIIGAMF